MANAWTGDNFVVLEVFQNEDPDQIQYQVKIQRLPENTYIEPTYWFCTANAANENNVIEFPMNLNLNDFLTNALPQINTFLTSIDAASYTKVT